MAGESKRREVLELLKGYRAFKSPFGGAFALEDATMKDANYGPSGLVVEGAEYHPKVRQRLKESYELLDHAIGLAKRDPAMFTAWVLLHEPYFGDPGDPSVVAVWREKSPNRAEYHDRFVAALADLLRHKDLFVLWPQRLSVREEKQLERRNDELYAEYRRVKEEKLAEGLSERKANRKAVETAAVRHGYSIRRVYEIVQIREGRKAG